jgi:hypothetical protein
MRIRVRDVPARAGIAWIRRGFRAFARHPAGFMGLFGMFLLAMIAMTLPLAMLMPLAERLGIDAVFVQLAGVVFLMPLLSLGFMMGTEAVDNDLRVRPTMLFAPLARPGAGGRRSLAALGLGYIAVLALAAVAGHGMEGAAELHAWLVRRASATTVADAVAAAAAPLGDAAAAVLALKAAVIALGSIPLWHAPALVQWGRLGARQAMFGSVVALWRTRAAGVVFVLGWVATVLVSGFVLGFVELLLQGSALFVFIVLIGSWILSAAFYVSLWFGFVDTFDIRAPETGGASDK